MLVGIIPDKEDAYQQGLKIIHTDKYGCSTVAFNPIISSGIVRFGGFFGDPDDEPVFMIGIADSSAVFGSNEWPNQGENVQKTVCYWIKFLILERIGFQETVELNSINLFPVK
ncbi:MAG: hypothetical protein EZS28_045201 [Streblomastix strix]|uniref:Uncharacterized protein n=1 Tax=Streblomastix strix TaxID=222440 RepID=A0A5J4TN05_9EUKA|nr:MAG: hypothetical protein EZS28_045201 [Streblomastix strix]